MARSTLIILVVAILLLCILALWLPRIVVDRRASGMTIEDRLSAENDMRSTAFQAITALVLIVGAGVTIKQLKDTADATGKQIDATRQQITLTRDSQKATQFTGAVGQLSAAGARNLPTRLGGIYSLTQLAASAPEYRQSVFDVLTAYVRQAGPHTRPGVAAPVGPLSARDPALQSVLNVIGKKLPNSAHATIGLSLDLPDSYSLYLGEADFSSGNFSTADFKLDALDNANFAGTNLRGACLLGASVSNTNFKGADLRGANFRQVENLNEALFSPRTMYDKLTKWPPDAAKSTSAFRKILKTMQMVAVQRDELHPAQCES